MRNPSISVIIPHLNQPEALVRCLSALACQNGCFELVDILVVDNGSVVFPDALCAGHPSVTLLSETEWGPGPARNTGVAHASGEILAFVDADCVPHLNWLAVITKSFRNNPGTEITGGPVRIEIQHDHPLSALEAYERIYAFRIEDYVRRQNFVGTGNMAVRQDVLTAVGPFAGIEVSEDLDWGQRAHKLGYRIQFNPDMAVSHPTRGSFVALKQKWDRQIAHQQGAIQRQRFAFLRTVLIAGVLAVSPLIEIPRILTSHRVRGARQRWLAFVCLTRIRLYRACRMLSVLTLQNQDKLLSHWNRP
ncbi:MAG: glycosyltransferase family A protein [Pseudomonadota bacterium]